MATSLGNVKRYRKSYSRIKKIIDIPNLIDIQKRSYDRFLQADVPPMEREPIGLQGVFQSLFPIKDFSGSSSLEFVCYKLEKPKYDVQECWQRGMTYAAPFKVVIRLVVWDTDDETGTQNVRDIKEQEVYFGDIPLMTDSGTFIVNGTERVIVSQLHRSPGVFFDHDKGKTHSSGKLLYNARVIPYRGSWLDFEFDTKDILHVRIDRRRKMPATILLKALGYTADEILQTYYDEYYDKLDVALAEGGEVNIKFEPELFMGQIATSDIKVGGTVYVRKNKRITQGACLKMKKDGVESVTLEESFLYGQFVGADVVDMETGEVLAEVSQEIDEALLNSIREGGISEFQILHTGNQRISTSLRDTLLADKVSTPLEAMIEIYKRLRPGDPPTEDTATTLFNNLFFNAERYDLSKVGRVKMNYKLGLDAPVDQQTLSRDDILAVVFYLLNLKEGRGEVDDIDHLGNRRVRAVGELVENQYRIGLVRMERAIRERMSLQEIDSLMPHDLINSKPVSAVIKEFFGSSQLSQFMDQTNPLSEVTHKRRLSALGPGGLTRERAGFEVRDVHNTHYGRICPVETPEGPNIGLIASLSTYARVNEYGFIETPYRPVQEDGSVSKDARFLSALEEERYVIAQANVALDEKLRFVNDTVAARDKGEFALVPAGDINYMDVSPNQLVSVAASLIPFLANDDANRALMGSNMQRQAVPLLKTAAPVIGTGMEAIVARDSGVTIVAKRGGEVVGVDATRIVVKVDESEHDAAEAGVDIYNLIKYQRSNQNTCINQKPIVTLGEKVKKGDIIADGPSTDMGELALGQNVTVAFMPWLGYNYEDSILISENLIKDDRFTSLHVEVFECISRDTKLGKEEITRDIPNVSEEMLANLDDSGIIRVGAEVKPGDILVGKITPKGETQLSPEEKLLRAIFGEKAGDVRDTSLTVPPGVFGIVLDAKVFVRKGVEKDERAKEIENYEIAKILKDQKDEEKIFTDNTREIIANMIGGKKLSADLTDDSGKTLAKKGTVLDLDALREIPFERLAELSLPESGLEGRVSDLVNNVLRQIEAAREQWEEKIERVKRSDEMSPGIIKMVKVYVAIKRKLQVGDKMAGRHGNKGVLSKIVPEEDMPFMEDGRPVEMVLNPLGVPSRMNVGQILETHLGWAGTHLGRQIDDAIREHYGPDKIRAQLLDIFSEGINELPELHAKIKKASDDEILTMARALSQGVHMGTPVFDGANEDDIRRALELAQQTVDGQSILFDGRTGDPIYNNVTVGTMYMLKLHHLVDDKIHARSIGPYSLVTQQPLGGKAQFGGQRLGEMEVWAMEAYGAAYCLQEFLTVKSDDVLGRTRMYESIVKGEYRLEPGLPESFNVLVKELQGLALDFTMSEDEMAGELTEEDLAEQVVRAAQARESASSSLDAADALFSREALGASSDDDEDDDSDEDDEDGEEEEDL
ncbi:MAG: DNA-directed RNA polymerase subunit beta [Deltaproteobacteria bacterium]|nr:DNA-directed RNA polymerase subunit beta [Deltaproteobacteria bacterium]